MKLRSTRENVRTFFYAKLKAILWVILKKEEWIDLTIGINLWYRYVKELLASKSYMDKYRY